VQLFDIAAILLTLAALFGYVNHRFVGLPTTIGVMVITMVMSLAMVTLGKLGFPAAGDAVLSLLGGVDFDRTLMHGMLSFLLFAGALHVDLGELARHRAIIATLATVGVVFTTFAVGTLAWVLFAALDLSLGYGYCLLFGALIAPTDPVAVLAILRTAGVPASLQTKVAGESLFNDGVAVVVFLVIYGVVVSGEAVSAAGIAELFVVEAVGGMLYGLLIGWLVYRALASVDNYQIEVLLTLALVMGGYTLATHLHVSGPLAMVVAGLLIGNRGRRLAMSERTREHLDNFWELVDEILNAVLFLLIGLEVLAVEADLRPLAAGLLVIPLVLLARFVSVGVPVMVFRRFRDFSPGAVRVLTWGGLRGGISVALALFALSLPAGEERDLLLTVAYVVVVFSIVVQGLTIRSLVSRVARPARPGNEAR
jgi:CPA1 family monovalent cation:H+ antiporter